MDEMPPVLLSVGEIVWDELSWGIGGLIQEGWPVPQ
jgi:hypothetical protein